MDYREVNERNRPRLQGQAGVHRVASELLLRGFNPCFPSVDCGADLIIEGGVRIQVKSAHLRMPTPGQAYQSRGSYWYKLARGPYASGNNKLIKRAPRKFSCESDFVIFWGIEENRFWIVPSEMLDDKQLVVVGTDIEWRGVIHEDIKRLISQGLTAPQVAEKLGVSATTIYKRIRGVYVEPRTVLVREVRERENRWDLITQMVNTLTESLVDSDTSLIEKEI